MNVKVKCPLCATWLVSKARKRYYYSVGDDYSNEYHLSCNHCNKFNVHLKDKAYTDLRIMFKFGEFEFNCQVAIKPKNDISIKIYLINNFAHIKIKEYSFNELCDKNVDILDYNEVYWFFKKEAKKWIKLRAFL